MDQLLGDLVKKWVDCYRKASDRSVPMASLPWDCPNKGLASPTVQTCQRGDCGCKQSFTFVVKNAYMVQLSRRLKNKIDELTEKCLIKFQGNLEGQFTDGH